MSLSGSGKSACIFNFFSLFSTVLLEDLGNSEQELAYQGIGLALTIGALELFLDSEISSNNMVVRKLNKVLLQLPQPRGG